MHASTICLMQMQWKPFSSKTCIIAYGKSPGYLYGDEVSPHSL